MNSIDLKEQPLELDTTLACGQAFRWRRTQDGFWQGVVGDRLVRLRVEDGVLYWKTYPDDDSSLIKDYLRLGDDVRSIYADLSQCDTHLAEQIKRFHGLRLLRQEPSETLFSFMCSAANSINRISAAIEDLAGRYGDFICEENGVCYHAFPDCRRLADADLTASRSLGFRGKNIMSAARQILENGPNWLDSLRDAPYDQAREQLSTLTGVGLKIADCVCLFALDKDESVPVDTHVRQLAHRLFLPEIDTKSMTVGLYYTIAQVFRDRYGNRAGWAQQFLYYEDLLRA